MRLDKFLSEKHPKYSRATWQKFIREGYILVNEDKLTNPSKSISPSDNLTLNLPEPQNFSDKPLPIIYEDSKVLVLDKPTGVLTHSKGVLNSEFTVADFVKSHITKSCFKRTNRQGIVHRLDRATSGVIITAKDSVTEKFLKKQFQDKKVKKTYLAVLERAPEKFEAVIDAPIARNPKRPATFRVDPNGKSAITYYQVLSTNKKGQVLVELKPETGRTHQLRVHMAFIGTPILGDPLYGGDQAGRLYLHAKKLEITIPGTSQNIRKVFIAPVPKELLKDFPNVKIK